MYNFFVTLKKYLVIIFTFIISFLISNYALKNIFIANSPKINPFYLTNLTQQIKNNFNNIYLVVTFSKSYKEKLNYTSVNSIPQEYFKPIFKGVSAYEKKDGEIIFKINNREVNIIPKDIEVNGRRVKVIDLTGE
jgi:hypothetical protein